MYVFMIDCAIDINIVFPFRHIQFDPVGQRMEDLPDYARSREVKSVKNNK